LNKQMNDQTKQNDRKRWDGSYILIGIVFLAGLILLLYPTIADYWNSYHQSKAIISYSDSVSALSEAQKAQQLARAKEYNAALAQNGLDWHMSDEAKSAYVQTLDFAQDGAMGYIVIDKLKVRLPIYHGTNEKMLETSIGHLEETSLPIGAASYDRKEERVTDENDGSHCVLTGHRGLPSARLFSDLDKLKEGDLFTLTVLDETYTYQVDQIRIVEPDDLTQLDIEKGKDLCTLVTCTPYGVNTHRLLVRGHRVADLQGEVTVNADAIIIDSVYVAPFIAAPVILTLVLIVIFGNRKPKKGVNR